MGGIRLTRDILGLTRDKQGPTRDGQGQTRDSQGQNRDNQGQVAYLVKYPNSMSAHLYQEVKLDGVGPVNNTPSTNKDGGPIHLWACLTLS